MASERWIMHVDMDAFFASVEQLDNPGLAGLPVIIGGLDGRGVVCTCSYEARRYGVHSAMATAQARQLCPQAVFLRPRMRRYQEMSRRIMAIFRATSPLVEQLSVDEAFLDLSGTEGLYGSAEQAGWLVKRRIKEELGLTASVGLAPNKFLAKLASDLQKPDGFTIIRHEEARSFIAPLPVRKIFGIGKAAGSALQQLGVTTIGQLAELELGVLQQVFGKNAREMQLLARGIDYRPVENSSPIKSVGHENTFAKDLYTYKECRRELLLLSQQTGYRLRRHGLSGRTLVLKVKYADFKIISRNITSESDICCDEEIYELATQLLRQADLSRGVRLLGITVTNLSDGSVSLDFGEDKRRRQRNAAVDALKARFGSDVIARGIIKGKSAEM